MPDVISDSIEETLTRTDVEARMDEIAIARCGVPWREVLQQYNDGRLDDPGNVIEVIALSHLL